MFHDKEHRVARLRFFSQLLDKIIFDPDMLQ